MEGIISEESKRHIDTFYDDNPFLALLGVRLTSFSFGRVRLDMEIRHEFTNVYGISHGGVTTTLADTAMGGACLACNKRVVTLDMHISFMKAVAEGVRIYAVGEALHDGSRTMVCEGRVYDEKEELCLKTTGTFFVLEELL